MDVHQATHQNVANALSASDPLSGLSTVSKLTEAMLAYRQGQIERPELITRLKGINTPEAHKILMVVESPPPVHEPDTTDVVKLLQQLLEQSKKPTPELPEPADYSDNFQKLQQGLESVKGAVEAQETTVTVPAPKVQVDAPDLSPISEGMDKVEKAVKQIKLGEVVDGATETKQINTLIDFRFDEYRLIYDSFDDSAEPQVEQINYYFKGKRVGAIGYKYDKQGNITSGKRI